MLRFSLLRAAAMALAEEVVARIHTPCRLDEHIRASGRTRHDEQNGGRPERGRVVELTRLDLRVPKGFVDEPHRNGAPEEHKDGRAGP